MKYITLTLLLLGMSFSSVAQDKEKLKEDRKAKKVAFITTKLDLTSSEAEKFWPIYNEAEAERIALRKEHKAAKPDKKISEMTDAEVEKLIDTGLDMQQKELDLKKKYHAKFKEILPIKKVAKLIHLEHEFRKSQKPKKGNHPGPPPGGENDKNRKRANF